MFTKLRILLTTILTASAVLFPVLVPATVAAQNIEGNLCAGVNLNVNDTNCDPSADTAAMNKINGILHSIINIFSLVVGVVSVIMIIIGGLKYITSSGDAGNVSSAQKTIIYALVGLVIVALAQVIVRFVLAKATQA
ncbi:MAG: rane protein [Candidatus Saccharibacteria bacterium]|nr:rane protein [Candidatus Saccharibacteria bacterium]